MMKHKISREDLKDRLGTILDDSIDVDWIWNGEDEIRNETFDMGHAMVGLIELFSEFCDVVE